MHYRVLLDAIRRRPFAPFNVVMSSGEKYRVEHPENMAIAKHAAIILLYDKKRKTDIADDFVFASYLHMSALEPILPPKPRSTRSRSR